MAKFSVVIFKELHVFITVEMKKRKQPKFTALRALREAEDSAICFN